MTERQKGEKRKMKKGHIATVALIVLLAVSVVGYSALQYAVKTKFKVKAYFVPTVQTVDLGEIFFDYDQETGSLNQTAVNMKWKTWEDDTNFTVTLMNGDELGDYFESFSAEVGVSSGETATVDLDSDSDQLNITNAGSGLWWINFCWTTLDDATLEENEYTYGPEVSLRIELTG